MLDTYVWGEALRISPEAPVPVLEVRDRTHRPGGAANAAAGVVALGGVATVGGVVGVDPAADLLRTSLSTSGVRGDGLVPDPARPTTTKTRFIVTNQQVVRVDEERREPLSRPTEDSLIAWAREQLGNADAALLSDYGKGAVTPRVASAFVSIAAEAGLPVVVDPKGTHFAKYAGATVVTPNVSEARHASRVRDPDDAALDDVARDLAELLGGAALLITRGGAGMRLYVPGDSPDDVPALAREVYDVTGAGDTVAAVLAAALGRGIELPLAVRLAAAAAAVAVGHVGAARVTSEELRRVLRDELRAGPLPIEP
jgi:D-beta-D-heptose 7-phosphate kinase/D-beta-D-heptose 1-phosphate adenosyltransferase